MSLFVLLLTNGFLTFSSTIHDLLITSSSVFSPVFIDFDYLGIQFYHEAPSCLLSFASSWGFSLSVPFPDFSCFFLPPDNGLHRRLSSGTPCMTQSPSGFGSSVWHPTVCFLVSLHSFSSAFDIALSGRGDTILSYLYLKIWSLIRFLRLLSCPHPVDGQIPLTFLWGGKVLPSSAYQSPSSHTWTAPLPRFPDSSLSPVYLALYFQSYYPKRLPCTHHFYFY